MELLHRVVDRQERAQLASAQRLRVGEGRGGVLDVLRLVAPVGLGDGRPPVPGRDDGVGVHGVRGVGLVRGLRGDEREPRSVVGGGLVEERQRAVLDDGGAVAGDGVHRPVVVVGTVVVDHRVLQQPLLEVRRIVGGLPGVEVLAEQAGAVARLLEVPLHGGVLVQVVRARIVQHAVVVRLPSGEDRGAGRGAERRGDVPVAEPHAMADEPVDGLGGGPLGLLGLVVGEDDQDVGPGRGTCRGGGSGAGECGESGDGGRGGDRRGAGQESSAADLGLIVAAHRVLPFVAAGTDYERGGVTPDGPVHSALCSRPRSTCRRAKSITSAAMAAKLGLLGRYAQCIRGTQHAEFTPPLRYVTNVARPAVRAGVRAPPRGARAVRGADVATDLAGGRDGFQQRAGNSPVPTSARSTRPTPVGLLPVRQAVSDASGQQHRLRKLLLRVVDRAADSHLTPGGGDLPR